MKVIGLLMAGGRSSRFGSEKAVFPLGDGRLMMDVPLAALRQVCTATAVSARLGSLTEAHAKALGLPCLYDLPGDPDGPLAGIRAGLEWASASGADWMITAPCDAPTVGTVHLEGLLAVVGGKAPVAVATSDQGWEPLLAIWPVRAGLSACAEALSHGQHPSIRSVLESLGAVAVEGYDGVNVNRREDLPTMPG